MTILAFIRTIMVGTGWAVWITFAAFALFLFALAWADRRMRLRLEAEQKARESRKRMVIAIMHSGPAAGTYFPEARHPLDSVPYDIRKLT